MGKALQRRVHKTRVAEIVESHQSLGVVLGLPEVIGCKTDEWLAASAFSEIPYPRVRNIVPPGEDRPVVEEELAAGVGRDEEAAV